jgi:hypothetical protein
MIKFKIFICTIVCFFHTVVDYWANDGEKTQIIENVNNPAYFVSEVVKLFTTSVLHFLAQLSFMASPVFLAVVVTVFEA